MAVMKKDELKMLETGIMRKGYLHKEARRRTNKSLLKENAKLKAELWKIEKKKKTVSFYDSREWQELRYAALKRLGRKCSACRTEDGEMHVDHVKPRSLHPLLALDPDNLQILCRACNRGKSNVDETHWKQAKTESGCSEGRS